MVLVMKSRKEKRLFEFLFVLGEHGNLEMKKVNGRMREAKRMHRS